MGSHCVPTRTRRLADKKQAPRSRSPIAVSLPCSSLLSTTYIFSTTYITPSFIIMATDPDQSAVPILSTDPPAEGVHLGAEYPNPFQHQPPRIRTSQSGNYTISIPSIEQWPRMILEQLKTASQWLLWSCIQIRDAIQQLLLARDSSSEMYHALPLTSSDSFSEPGSSSSSRPRVSFGKRRHLRAGSGPSRWISKRRLGRLACLLCSIALLVTLFSLPKRLLPLRDRVVWVRYFNHEEPVMITLPYGKNLYVHEVKKIAMKELDMGYSTTHSLGNIRLLSVNTGKLWADQIWDNDQYEFSSGPYQPILAVDPRYELFKFLNDTLECFSGPEAFGNNLENIKFKPWDNFQSLRRILSLLTSPSPWDSIHNRDITYLRAGFKDPLHQEYLYPEFIWTSRNKTELLRPTILVDF
ncbi:MAG: hypothetical protein J3Q66DRAFT_189979 [Benniella sp.]|nr:MAG: hypothetical protein J3Q66DRAFT_189979 [Benniella sp.]